MEANTNGAGGSNGAGGRRNGGRDGGGESHILPGGRKGGKFMEGVPGVSHFTLQVDIARHTFLVTLFSSTAKALDNPAKSAKGSGMEQGFSWGSTSFNGSEEYWFPC